MSAVPTARTAVAVPSVKLLINGEFVESTTSEWRDVINPATQQVLARVPMATAAEVAAAVAAGKAAFKSWKKTPIGTRARIFLKLQQLIREHMKELAAILTAEQGKTLADAEGDVFRGLEVVEHAANIGSLQLGDYAENVAGGVDTYSVMQPLGVCAGITPFNFPAMIPLWMFPMAIATGNTFVLKPSEQDPMVTMRLCELALEAGIPPGVLNVVQTIPSIALFGILMAPLAAVALATAGGLGIDVCIKALLAYCLYVQRDGLWEAYAREALALGDSDDKMNIAAMFDDPNVFARARLAEQHVARVAV